MIRAILLAVDGFEHSPAAAQSAIALGVHFRAEINAFGIVDNPWVITPQGKVEQLGNARNRMREALRQLQASAESVGIAAKTAEVTGDPLELLATEATQHDLVVLGRSTGFRPGLVEGALDVAINALVRTGSRAILAVRERPAAARRVLVAFDGSAPASRCLHMAALLGLTQIGEVQVLSIDADRRAADALAQRAAELLRRHGANVSAMAIGSVGEPAELTLSHAENFGADLIVMGAYGRSGLRDLLFGSCTRRLMAESTAALLIQH